MAVAIPSIAVMTPTPAFAQTTGGRGGPLTLQQTSGLGGGYEQAGGAGVGAQGGGGGGPGAAGTLGGAPGNNSSGGGGAGGINGTTAATILPGNSTGGNGGDATPSVDATTVNGGGGGAGGFGYVLTAAGNSATTAGQVFTGGTGGAGNGNADDRGGSGGNGGGGLLLLQGGTFTNVQGASLIGGAGGLIPSSAGGPIGVHTFGGAGLVTSNYVGATFAATVVNAGVITGGAGGAIAATPVAPLGRPQNISGSGGDGAIFNGGGSFANTVTGVITGGLGGAAFAGSPTLAAGLLSGPGGTGLSMLQGGTATNDGQIRGGQGGAGPIGAASDRLQSSIGVFFGSSGGVGVSLAGPTSAVSLVNNATGVIAGGAGGLAGSGFLIGGTPTAGAGGHGGEGVTAVRGNILNLGQILGGSGGNGADATNPNQRGGFSFNQEGGTGIRLDGFALQAGSVTVDNRSVIKGGNGGAAGASGVGALGANGAAGGLGIEAISFTSGAHAILNTGSITGGNGGAASNGTTNGTTGAGGIGISMRGDGTITNSAAISGGLSGDGATRANAITFLAGVHTLTLQTGATFGGNVVVNTTASFDPGVSANNTLNLDGAGSGTVSLPQFQNFGHLTQTGAGGGTWTVTGAGAFTVGAAVSAGTMVVDGSLTAPGIAVNNGGTLRVNGNASAVTVNAGGTLGGAGTVGSTTVNSGGTLSPGNSIGVITINGNLVLGAGSVYLVEVSPTSADRTNVSGTATLGGTVHAIFGPGSYTSNSYTILSAVGGRSGQFNALTTSGLPATLSASLSYTSTDVALVTLTSQIGPTLPGLIGTTPNQRAVAFAQDTAFNRGLPNITALYGLSLAQLPGALDQLSGEVHVSTAGVLAEESRYMRDAVLGRLRQASYGGNTQMASLSVGGPQAFSAGEELSSALAYAKSPIITKAPPMVAPTYDVTFWAQGFGARGRFETDGNAATVRRDLAGFISGIDTRVGSNGRLGFAAGYTGSKNALDNRGASNVETAHIAGYGGWNFGAFNLRAGAAYAFHTIATDRLIAFPGFFDRTTANYDGHTGQIFGELGYGVSLGNVAVEPFAGAAWVRVTTDAAAERGGAAALNVAGTTFETGYTTLGIRAASIIPLANDMVLIPRGTLAWQHAFDNVTPAGVLAFQAAQVPFTIAGVPIARDALLAEAGLDLAIGRNATLGISYIGQIASNVQDHGAKGKFSWKF